MAEEKSLIELAVGEAIELALGEVLTSAYRRVMRKRVERAREIIIHQLRTAEIDPAKASANDDVIGMMISVMEAVRQNAAFRNLRVMAQILAHRIAHPEDGDDEFSRQCDVIGTMSRKETIFLTTLYRELEKGLGRPQDADQEIWSINERVREELLATTLFENKLEYTATGIALGRTGYLVQHPFVDDQFFNTTPQMKSLAKMVRLDEWAASALAGDD